MSCDVLFEGGTVQAAVQVGGKAQESTGPSARLHRRPNGEILGPPQQVVGAAGGHQPIAAEISATCC